MNHLTRFLIMFCMASPWISRAQDPLLNKDADRCVIRVVDDRTGRGVPLVEFETVHHLLFLTDNDGSVSISEPDLLGRDVFFFVRSHGYRFTRDGFGFEGTYSHTFSGNDRPTPRYDYNQILYRLDLATLFAPTP